MRINRDLVASRVAWSSSGKRAGLPIRGSEFKSLSWENFGSRFLLLRLQLQLLVNENSFRSLPLLPGNIFQFISNRRLQWNPQLHNKTLIPSSLPPLHSIALVLPRILPHPLLSPNPLHPPEHVSFV